MITAIVACNIPQGMTREQWHEHATSVSTSFEDIPGPIRKQFRYRDQGDGCGVYP